MHLKEPEGESGLPVGMEPSAVLYPVMACECQSGFMAIETMVITFQIEVFVSMEWWTRTARSGLLAFLSWPVSFCFRVQ